MYNPFPLLNERLLQDKIAEGKRYFVRQTYGRGIPPKARLKASFLLRAYDADEKEIALQHLEKIKHDSYSFLYDALQAEHLEKLTIAARQPFGFKIYYAGKKGEEWKPPREYQWKMKNYLRQQHPGWRTEPGGDKIQAGIFEELGSLFIKFSFEGEEDKQPLDIIENY